MKKLLSFILATALLLLLAACAPEEWKTYTSGDGKVSFRYLSPKDTLSAVDEMEIYGVYRKNAFTVSVSVQGTSRDLDTMGESLAKYYTNKSVTVSPDYVESSVGNVSCRMLPLSGSDIAEGGVFYFYDESSDDFYTVYYSVSQKAGAEMIAHVREILDSLRF